LGTWREHVGNKKMNKKNPAPNIFFLFAIFLKLNPFLPSFSAPKKDCPHTQISCSYLGPFQHMSDEWFN
jgi:hypothetical protein